MMENNPVVKIADRETYEKMINAHRGRPYGLFLVKYEEKEWLAVDNRKGRCYATPFKTPQEAYNFLVRL